MTIRRSAVIGALCLLAVGCDAANRATDTSPSSLTTSARSSGDYATGASQLTTQSIGSCPDGNAPTWLQPWTKGTTARLRWTDVAPNIDYHVVVEHYDWTNQYVPVDNGDFMVVNNTWTELTLGEGRYRAKIQTKSCGKYMGPWSEMLQFSVEGDESPASGPSVPVESLEGARAFPNSGQSIVDATGTVWTFGVEVVPSFYRVLQDGIWTPFIVGSQLKYHNHGVYHLGTTGDWYFWNGSGWTDVGPTEP